MKANLRMIHTDDTEIEEGEESQDSLQAFHIHVTAWQKPNNISHGFIESRLVSKNHFLSHSMFLTNVIDNNRLEANVRNESRWWHKGSIYIRT